MTSQFCEVQSHYIWRQRNCCHRHKQDLHARRSNAASATNSLADDCTRYLHTCSVNFNSWKSPCWFAFSSEVQYYCWRIFSASYTSVNQRESLSFWYSEVFLDRSAVRYLWWNLATFIRDIYDTAKRSYSMFCFLIVRVKYSTSISNLISWSANLENKIIKVKIIKIYLIDLWSHHIDVEYSDIEIETFHHSTLQRIIVEIRRLQDDDQTRKRRSITWDLLLLLLRQFDQSIIEETTWHASFCLTFANFLRMSEFTWSQSNRTSDFKQWYLIRSSIIFQNDSLQLILSSFKIDSFRREVTLIIAVVDDEACVKNSLVNLFSKFSAFLLTSLFDSEYSYMRTHIIEILRRTLVTLSIENRYLDHFFRRDAAISARQAKLSKNEIQLLERWKFDSYRLYIEVHSSYILNISKRHQR